jgi:oligopeptidase A
LLQKRYAFSEQEVKQYFTEPKVLGRFVPSHRKPLQRQSKVQTTAPVWHEDVRFYRLETPAGTILSGSFTWTSTPAKPNAVAPGWMKPAPAAAPPTGIQKPIAYLNCNFARPVGGKPATFTHDDVITLFHETGHGLHHLLTRGEELGVSGIHGVEWDAVELPSQFMENYCWEWNVVARHVSPRRQLVPLCRARCLTRCWRPRISRAA